MTIQGGSNDRPRNSETPQAEVGRGPRRRNAALIGIVLLSLLVRGYVCLQPFCINPDGVHFISFAKQLADDPVRWMKITTKQPGFSYVLLATHKVFGPLFGGDTPRGWQRCGIAISLFGGAFTCVAVFLLARRLFDDRIAATAGILACFWPQGAQLSADVLSDTPHSALYLCSMLIVYDALIRPQPWKLGLGGLLAGLAYMVRQEAIGLIPAVVFCIFWRGPRSSGRNKALGSALFVICFLAPVAPYSIATGKIMPNKSPQDLIDRVFSQTSLSTPPAFPLAHAIPLWQTPGRMAEEWARSGRYILSTLFLVAMFLKTVPRAEPNGRRLLLALVLVQLVLVQFRVGVFGEISSRYTVVPAALCIPWAAAALVTVLTALSRRFAKPTPSRIVPLWTFGYLLALAPMFYFATLPINRAKRHYPEAGAWLNENAEPTETILAHRRLTQLMFYAGRTYPDQTWIACRPSNGLAEIRKLVGDRQPAWYVDVADSRAGEEDDPKLLPALLDGELPRLRPVRTFGASAFRVHVFRVTHEE